MARLGRTLSAIGFGAFKIGRNQGIKYPSGYELPDDPAVSALLNGVLDLGINYIDTAPAYGLSEERIGRAIGQRRDEYFVSTKVGETYEAGKSVYDFSAKAVRASVQRSLKRLRADVLDAVLVHSRGEDLAILNETDVVETLVGLRDEGLVRAIGFSGYSEEGFSAALTWCDAIMVTYHCHDRSLEPVIRAAADRGVDVLVKKGLGSGRLGAEEAVSFVLGNPGVTSLVVGTLVLDHVRENLAVARRIRRESAIAGPAPDRREHP